MAGDDWTQLVWAGVVLVAVASSLLARRVPLVRAAQFASAWVVIFAVVYLGFVYRDDLRGIGARVMNDVRPDAPRQAGKTVEITQSDDGHFWIRATVDGYPVRFLIDSGATTTGLSAETVRGAQLEAERFGGIVETANGAVPVQRVVIGRLEAGGIVRQDFAAVTTPAFGSTNVLGMNFLSSLSGWSVRGRTLILTP